MAELRLYRLASFAALACSLYLVLAGPLYGCGNGGLPGGRRATATSAQPSAGHAGGGGAPHSADRSAGAYREGDEDEDRPLDRPDPDDSRIRDYGQPATAADTAAAKALVKRFYAVALRRDASAGCRLISERLRTDPHLGVIEEELYPPPLSLPPLSGASCRRILSVLYKEAHSHIEAEAGTARVILVRTDGRLGVALLGFKASPERLLHLERDRGQWRLTELLDGEVP